MKRSEYEERLKELNRQYEELQKIEIEEYDVWKPEIKENYYMVSGNGTVNKTMWIDYDGEELRLDFGNVFKTKEEAEYEAERLKVYRKLRQFALSKGRHVGCFCISFDYVYKEINYDKNETGFAKYGDLVFKTEEDARRAVEAVGAEKVLKYYLEV